MKFLFLPLLLLLTNLAFGQNGMLPLNEDKQATYSDKAILSTSQDLLYKRAQSWIVKAFGNYENAIVKQDPASGLLVINSYVPVSTSLYDYIRFDMTISCSNEGYTAFISKLDGTAQYHTPIRLGKQANDLVTEKEMALKTETNRKKRAQAETALERVKKDHENINTAMYKVLAGLKENMIIP